VWINTSHLSADGAYGESGACPDGFNFGGPTLVPAADVLPLPAAVQGIAVDPAVGYTVEELEPGLHALTDGTYLVMILETDTGVVLFDSPPSLQVQLSSRC
jgi:hypothetical protein